MSKKTTKKAAPKRRSKATKKASAKKTTRKKAPTKKASSQEGTLPLTAAMMGGGPFAEIPNAIYLNDPTPAKDPTPPGEIIVKEPLEKRMAAIQAIAESNRDLAKALTTVAASVKVEGCMIYADGTKPGLRIDQGAPGGE